ncbi:hypothetical protein PR202_gb25902 [Eleusine coracana subsp. coracana]|uniref:Uncharacterized protein n=1 Tax=Eleusine coracana subsp. coracana TaxID=191504 RepID=A0AAV5FRV1_ELECO|nr:hypothetical protein PR202_gb25902 [Eleusine coracana subsp. coracana]
MAEVPMVNHLKPLLTNVVKTDFQEAQDQLLYQLERYVGIVVQQPFTGLEDPNHHVQHFIENVDDSIGEAWERYNEYMDACPHHCLTVGEVVEKIYTGLNLPSRQHLDASAAGDRNWELQRADFEAYQDYGATDGIVIASHSRQQGAIPGSTKSAQQLKAIATRSGKQIEDPEHPTGAHLALTSATVPTTPIGSLRARRKDVVDLSGLKMGMEAEGHGPATFLDTQLLTKTGRVRQHDEQFARFVDIMKKLYINVPFVDAIQVPTYDKYIKDMMQNKKSLASLEVVKLTKELMAAINDVALEKKPDPRSRSIKCMIGKRIFDRCLCDLGARVSVKSRHIFTSVNFPGLEPTGRPFLRTAKASIDVGSGKDEEQHLAKKRGARSKNGGRADRWIVFAPPSGSWARGCTGEVVPVAAEGFTLPSTEEQEHYLAVRGRFVPNFDLDDTFLTTIGMWEDIRRMLSNLGWVDFHRLPMNYNLDIVTEVASMMRLDTDEVDNEAVNFLVRDISHTVTMEAAALVFGFDAEADVAGILGYEELESFCRRLSFMEEMKRGNISNLTIQVFHWWIPQYQLELFY